jgi:glycosyltransferase involved in cell wall biosynthesis
MKLAFIGGFAFGPKGTIRARAHPLAAELVRQGHEVTIFLPPYDNVEDSGREWMQEGVHVINLQPGSTSCSYPRLLADLIGVVNQYRPDIIHVFKPKGFAGAAGTYFLLKSKHKVVVDCDDWEGWGGWNDVKPYPWIVKEYIDWQECWLVRSAPALTVASRTLQQRASGARREQSGIFYVPNCAAFGGPRAKAREEAQSLSPLETRKALNLPDGPIILYSGHFEAGEDLGFFCRAAGPVAERNQASIVFVGEGPDLPKVREFFSNYSGLKVQFFPRLTYQDFVRVVWAAEVTAFPYPDNPVHRAKCSARIIDYMAMGKPVITSAVGQNHEYIVSGESGLLVTPSDESAFADDLELLLRDPNLRARLGSNARRRIREKFSWSGEPLQQCLAAYDQLRSA